MDCIYDITTCQGRIAIAEKYDAIQKQTLKPLRNIVIDDWINYQGDTYIITDVGASDNRSVIGYCHKVLLLNGNPRFTLEINLRKDFKRKDILVYQ